MKKLGLKKGKEKILSLLDYGLSLSSKDTNREVTLKVLSLILLFHVTLSLIGSFIGILSFLLSDLKVLVVLFLIILILFRKNIKDAFKTKEVL